MRGQVTLEFLGTVAVALLVYAVFSAYIMLQFSFLVPWQSQSPDARYYAQRIATHINYAYAAGDGYSSSFQLPEQIAGRDYIIAYDAANKVVEVDIVDLGNVDSFAVVNFLAPKAVVSNAGNGTNYVTNSNGTVAVRR